MRRLAILALFALLFAGPASAARPGDPAPAFSATDLAGNAYRFDGDGGRVAFVNFWATWCPPCVAEFPRLNELAAEYEGRVTVVAVSLDDPGTEARIAAFVDRHAGGKPAMTVVHDPRALSAAAYDVSAMPTSYIVDGTGVIRFTHRGFAPDDPAEWRREIDSLLPK